MDSGIRGVTGPCRTRRVVSRCQEANEPSTVMPCMSIRFFAAITSAGPMVDTAKKIFGGHMGDPTGPMAIAGSPQRVREQIQKHIDLGCTMFMIEFFGRTTPEPAKLFAETVLPKFR